jgi:3-(3-hydroxy-phenyl)propionate hydroxylase
LGIDFVGRAFEDNFLIADVVMEAKFPSERWFWFDPPFNRGQSALLHRQPDDVWRIDLQLGPHINKDEEKKPENVIPRLKTMLGDDTKFDLEWVSIYTFQCRRMENFRHDRVIFAGDSAHQVSPFGARGANSGIQDTDNLCWKLNLVIDGIAPETLLDTYNSERIRGADENILNSSRSTDFITPKSETSRLFRNAVLDLAEAHSFARPLVNSGRLSVPCIYDGSTLNSEDALPGAPSLTRPGAPCPDAPLDQGYLLENLGNALTILTLNANAPDEITESGLTAKTLVLPLNDAFKNRYLGSSTSAVYLVRPDQHIAARWGSFDATAVRAAIRRLIGRN